jgi:3-oxoadipate enol-lactonase
MGGMIAQELALRHRARIRSLALIATHAGGLRNLLPPLRGMRLFLEAQLGGKSRRIAALERLLFPDDYLARCDRAAVLESLRADFGGAIPLAQRLTQLGAAFRHEGRRLHELASVPTLIVRPGQDVLIRPRESDRLHRLIPGSRLVRIDEAGHGVIRQCAGRLNELLLEHFRLRDEAEPLFAAGG